MNREELQRYRRHLLLPSIGERGQERLLASRVLQVGVGGLGSPLALYLAAAGVGQLTLVDPDRVDLSNLQRQVIHQTPDIGRPKVESARDRLAALNPGVRVVPVPRALEGEELLAAARAADVVVDATDNFAARFAVNAACVEARRPLVSGAVTRWEGQVTVFRADQGGGPCYRCLYPEGGEGSEGAEGAEGGAGGAGGEGGAPDGAPGVVGPVVGIVGSVQATEVLKVLLGAGETLAGRLLVLDALSMEWRTLRLRRDPACPVCGPRAP